jgi:hypothetical protein
MFKTAKSDSPRPTLVERSAIAHYKKPRSVHNRFQSGGGPEGTLHQTLSAPIGANTFTEQKENHESPQDSLRNVWQQHLVAEPEGEPALLYIDLHLGHEVTSPQGVALGYNFAVSPSTVIDARLS